MNLKKIVYAPIPEFNESAQYVLQLAPVETEFEIYYGVEVRDLEVQEESVTEESQNNELPQPPEKPATIEERTSALETGLDEVVTILEAIV